MRPGPLPEGTQQQAGDTVHGVNHGRVVELPALKNRKKAWIETGAVLGGQDAVPSAVALTEETIRAATAVGAGGIRLDG